MTNDNCDMEILIALPAGVIIFALGASIGSFLNVVAYRLPAGLSILWPPSRCPHCLHQLGKRENIPILGWFWLRGRCRHCHSRIAIRYPLVEAVTGILFLLVFWVFSFSWQTVGYWALFSWLLALSLIDLDTMTLPNPLTKSGLIAGLIFQGANGFLSEASFSQVSRQLFISLVGAVVGIWVFDIIRFVASLIFKREAMGDADPKLAAMLGAWLGWQYLLLAGFLACAVGAFVGGGAIALGWLSRQRPIPFGPLLALGAVLTVFWGEAIWKTYTQLFFPFGQ